MRWFAWLLLILAIAVALAMLAQFGNGNVAILWPPYRIDVSLNLAILLLAAIVLAGHVLLRLGSRALSLPRDWRSFWQRRSHERSVRALNDALRAYFEGRFGRAERLAGQAANAEGERSGVPALVAARAAHRLGERERRERWLEQAGADPDSKDSLLMTRAELLLDENQPREALALLRDLLAGGANLAVQRLALRAHEQAGDWDEVLAATRALEKRDALAPSEIGHFRLQAFRGLLERAEGDPEQVSRLVGRVPSVEQRQPRVAVVLADALKRAGDTGGARKLLEQSLAAGPADDSVVRRYLALDDVAAVDRLQVLEKVRTREGDSPVLLFALGELCVAEQLWGKAESYLKRSLELQDSAQAHLALGRLYERLERADEARLEFKAGAEAAAIQPPAPDAGTFAAGASSQRVAALLAGAPPAPSATAVPAASATPAAQTTPAAPATPAR